MSRVGVGVAPSWPRLPHVFVARETLWRKLDAAMTSGAVAMLVAPAGAGKTLGTAGWLQARGHFGASWFTATTSTSPAVVAKAIDATTTATPPEIIVIDDAHLLKPSCLAVIERRLDTQPDQLRLVLLARFDLPIARVVPELLGDLTIIRGDTVRLDRTEAEQIIHAHAGTQQPSVVDTITARSKGWCAAVVLAARAIGSSPDPAAAAARFEEAGPPLIDVVASEAFAALSDQERHLLLAIATEPVVTAEGAARLSGDPLAGQLLLDLEATGLLVSREPPNPNDRERTSAPGPPFFRVHPLLVEVVRRRHVAGGSDVRRARTAALHAIRSDVRTQAAPVETSFRRLVAVHAYEDAIDLIAADGLKLVVRGSAPHILDVRRRAGDLIDARPDVWFFLALERWLNHDLEDSLTWMDRLVRSCSGVSTARTASQLACIRLFHARVGLETIDSATEYAAAALADIRNQPEPDPLLPLLLCLLGSAHNWLGALDAADAELRAATRICDAGRMPLLAAASMTQLGFAEFMQGRESACSLLARHAHDVLDGVPPAAAVATRDMALTIAALAGTAGNHWMLGGSGGRRPDRGLTLDEPVTRFWHNIVRARTALAAGSAVEASRCLAETLDADGPLPRHLHVALTLEWATIALVAGDVAGLALHASRLDDLGVSGEAAFVEALRADVIGDLAEAERLYDRAAVEATYEQPATALTALVCRAQVALDRGDEALARSLAASAVAATSVRSNATPFLGWSRHGAPVSALLTLLDATGHDPWRTELVSLTDDFISIAAHFGPISNTVDEQRRTADELTRPLLTPRERDVLNELARGSTYADIAANLIVSENTVKTHVSALYAKLGVGRRSEALRLARSMHLL